MVSKGPTKAGAAAKKARAALKFFDGTSHGALSGYIDRYNGVKIDSEKI